LSLGLPDFYSCCGALGDVLGEGLGDVLGEGLGEVFGVGLLDFIFSALTAAASITSGDASV
jgi:hypothetical protein